MTFKRAHTLSAARATPRRADSSAFCSPGVSRALLLIALIIGALGCRDKPPPPPNKRPQRSSASAAAAALDEARAAAASAAAQLPADASACERALLERRAAARDKESAPSGPAFVARCEQLPAAVQTCLSLSHALENSSHCRQLFAGLTEKQRTLMRELNAPASRNAAPVVQSSAALAQPSAPASAGTPSASGSARHQ